MSIFSDDDLDRLRSYYPGHPGKLSHRAALRTARGLTAFGGQHQTRLVLNQEDPLHACDP